MLLTHGESGYDIFSQSVLNSGIRLLHFPVIKIKEIGNKLFPFSNISELNKFDIIILTSVNASKIFISKINDARFDLSKLTPVFAAVGKQTSEFCKQNKINISISPESDFSGAGLFEELKNMNLQNKKILIPCSKLSKTYLSDKLKEYGAFVEVVHTYDIDLPDKNIIDEASNLIKIYPPDVYMFTSPSTFCNFVKILKIDDVKTYFSASAIAAIGKVTKEAIENFGVEVKIVPEFSTVDELIKVSERFLLEN